MGGCSRAEIATFLEIKVALVRWRSTGRASAAVGCMATPTRDLEGMRIVQGMDEGDSWARRDVNGILGDVRW